MCACDARYFLSLSLSLCARTQGGEVKLSLAGLSPDEVVARVAANKDVLNDLLPQLPEDVFYYLTGPAFEAQCQIKFDEVCF
jgi:hypothetical protein